MATPLMSLPDQSPGKAKYVVPWKSRKEFLEIYHDLYSDDESLQVAATNRITTWKSRAGSKLSVAVENTGALFESIINHRTVLREGLATEKENVNILRSSYGLAIVRFVNFITEKGQTKQTAQPVHSLAREFGIPEWIVRIRHDVTHNVIPCLDMLATAASWAVQYLKEEFWESQNHDSADVDKYRHNADRTAMNKIRKSLLAYRKLRTKEIEINDTDQKTTVDELSKMKDLFKQDRFNFVKCVLEDGCFIPLEEQLENFQSSKDEILNQSSPRLPSQVVEFWHPVLVLLCNSKAIATFTKLAMFSLTDEDCVRNHLITGWLDFLLHNACTERSQRRAKKSSKSKKLVFADALVHKKKLLSVCLKNINRFTIHLLRYLLDKDELGDDAYLKLIKLLHYTPATTDECEYNSKDEEEDEFEEESDGVGSKDNVYTVEDLKDVSVHHSRDISPPFVLERLQVGVQEEQIGWRICTDIVDWSKVPLGIIPLNLSRNEGLNESNEEIEDNSNDDNEGQLKTSKEQRPEDDNSDDEEDEGERHSRDWKRSQRKRQIAEDLSSERTSPKLSKYVVNDIELL